MKNIAGPGVLLEGTLEQLHDCSFLGPYPQASYHGKVSEKKTSIGYFFSEGHLEVYQVPYAS
jgi:hypothetical protein